MSVDLTRRKKQSRQEIQQRVIDGLDKTFDRSAELTLYLRACERLFREGRSAQAEEEYEQAYFIFLRLVELIVTYIPRHSRAKDPAYTTKIRALARRVPQLMSVLGTIKFISMQRMSNFKKSLSQKMSGRDSSKLPFEQRGKRQSWLKNCEFRLSIILHVGNLTWAEHVSFWTL